MSEQETLRLAAEVVNKYSGPIREMQKSLRALQASVKNAHSGGKKDADAHARSIRELKTAGDKLADGVKGALTPAMAGLGIGAFGAAAGIAAVTRAVQGMSSSTRNLTFISREVGLTVQQLREFDALAGRIGSSPEQMNAGFERFADVMDQFRQHAGPLQQWFAQQRSGAQYLGRELQSTASNAEALAKVEETLSRIQDPVHRRRLLNALGLDPNLARLTGQELQRAFAEIRKNLGVATPQDIQKALEYQHAIDEIRESVSGLEMSLMTGLAPGFTRVAAAIKTFVEANRDSLVKTLSDVADEIAKADWAEIALEIRSTAKDVRDLAEAFGRLLKLLNWVNQFKVPDWLLGYGVGRRKDDKLFSFEMPPWLRWLQGQAEAGQKSLPPPPTGPLFEEQERERLLDGFTQKQGLQKQSFEGARPGFQPIAWRSGDLFPPTVASASPALRAVGEEIRRATEAGTEAGTIKAWRTLLDLARAPGGGAHVQNASYSPDGGMNGGAALGGMSDLGGLRAIPHAANGLRRRLRGGLPSDDHTDESPANDVPANDDDKGPYRSPGRPGDKRAGLGARYVQSMRVAEDELRRQGVPAENLRAAAAILVGNASAESELIPWTVHDYGTGYGIYGARLERRNGMLGWLAKNGYDRNSLVGQIREMAVRARQRGGAAWQALKSATAGNLARNGLIFEHFFEGPAVDNNRNPQIGAAYRAHRDAEARRGPLDRRAFRPGDLQREARRAGLDDPFKVKGEASVLIALEGFPKGTRTTSSASGLFKEVTTLRGKAAPLASQDN